MYLIGLTGSIGMGKSTTAQMFAYQGVPVFDADAVVHKQLAAGGRAVPAIAATFDGVVNAGAVDRQALGGQVFGDQIALKKLEAILHPLVGSARSQFLAKHRRNGRFAVVLDVPLLFETGGQKRCDYVCVVSAPFFLQKHRVLARAGMTEAKFHAILSKQTPDWQKRQWADVVLSTGLGRAFTFAQVRGALRKLRNRS